jgi:hypothetical protein
VTNYPTKGFETSNFALYFSGGCFPTNESLLLLALPTLAWGKITIHTRGIHYFLKKYGGWGYK